MVPARWRLSDFEIAMIASASIAAHLLLAVFLPQHRLALAIPLYIAVVAGGVPLLFTLFHELWCRQFGTDLLAGLSILTAGLLGQYLVAAIIVLMLSGGSALENLARRRASTVLEALARRMPTVAHRVTDSGIVDANLGDINVGDRLVIMPHEICPADGVVTDGHGVMDESYLTGEPFKIRKTTGAQTLSGAVNGDTALTIQVIRLAVDSRYAGIMQVVERSQQNRPRIRRVGDRLGAFYTPLAIAIAATAWIASGDVMRFLSVLVIATPCPLLIAIPISVIGAISVAAGRGIIVKNPAALEMIGQCRTLIFDKTGTLTYGEPAITGIVCAPQFTRERILQLAGSLEQYSKHPLAGAVQKVVREEGIVLPSAECVSERPGAGLSGAVCGREIEIMGRKQAASRDWTLPPAVSGLECIVAVDGSFAAAFRFHDAPRADSYGFIGHLKPKHGVNRLMLVSGDSENEVRYLAREVGITEIHAGKSPEEKVEIVARETRCAPTLFVGDGINDAAALLTATVGVAFGHSDITSEAADAVVLEPSLAKVDELIHIARRMRRIALESAVGGMVLSLAGMGFAAAGFLPPIGGAVAQEIIDLAAVLNAVRAAFPLGRLSDF